MRIAILIAALGFAACQQETADQPTTAAQQTPAAEATTPVAKVPRAEVEGWQTDPASYAMLGGTIPSFSLDRVGGGKVSQDDLRNRWTILGFWNATAAGIDEEGTYIRALNSAVDQDPDLDFLTVHLKIRAADVDIDKWFADFAPPWPTLVDKGGGDTLFSIQQTPAYLLIGPDLTIEGYRGALAATPDDGIKSVIRGVAEIRKQIAAPQ
ncbi:MAG: hypothetical protein Q8R02_20405 [Hyphomonadaceae bacterium]|nr:hypothetical protein [Hyphomonadaceae bacterium]